jgi:hypothetical protein
MIAVLLLLLCTSAAPSQAAAATAGSKKNYTILKDTDFFGFNAGAKRAATFEECAQQCLEHVSCMCVSWNGPDSTHKDLNCNFHCSTEGEQAPGAMSLPERFVRSLPIPRGCLPALPRTHRCAES